MGVIETIKGLVADPFGNKKKLAAAEEALSEVRSSLVKMHATLRRLHFSNTGPALNRYVDLVRIAKQWQTDPAIQKFVSAYDETRTATPIRSEIVKLNAQFGELAKFAPDAKKAKQVNDDTAILHAPVLKIAGWPTCTVATWKAASGYLDLNTKLQLDAVFGVASPGLTTVKSVAKHQAHETVENYARPAAADLKRILNYDTNRRNPSDSMALNH